MNKLERVNEMEKQLAALKAEIEAESKVEKWVPKGNFIMHGDWRVWRGASGIDYQNHGNVRATLVLAHRAIKRRLPRNLIAAYVDQYEPDYEPDFDGEFENCSIYYNHRTKKWGISWKSFISQPTEVYMPEWLAKQLIADIESGRVDLGYPLKEQTR